MVRSSSRRSDLFVKADMMSRLRRIQRVFRPCSTYVTGTADVIRGAGTRADGEDDRRSEKRRKLYSKVFTGRNHGFKSRKC